jgi:hypothetical protein
MNLENGGRARFRPLASHEFMQIGTVVMVFQDDGLRSWHVRNVFKLSLRAADLSSSCGKTCVTVE